LSDLYGVKRTLELEAESVYEAAFLALQPLRKADFLETPPALASRFHVVTQAQKDYCSADVPGRDVSAPHTRWA
jgi:hypothetical protein